MQQIFADREYAAKKRLPWRDRFQGELEILVPWAALCAQIDHFYLKTGQRGRQPGLERIFACINTTLSDKGLMLREGTIVDATIIEAPSSTKNQKHERDPQMHQTKKGDQWHFGMKAHIGVDAHSGLIHTVVSTAGNVHDVTQAHALLHGEEQYGHADAGYQGVDKREEMAKSKVRWFIAMRPGKRKNLPDTEAGRTQEFCETVKASIRAKVEHPFHIIKNLFGLRKVRYKGLAKNHAQLMTLFGLANLLIAKRSLFELREKAQAQGG